MNENDGSACFEYRTVLGCWINDVSSVPRVEQWPSLALDAVLEHDLTRFFDVLREVRLDSVVLFGLFTSRQWEPGFKATVSPGRAEAVRRILGEAGKRGVRVLYGLGLYSWGFEKIIRDDPDVRGSNPLAMCGSKAASHAKMEELVDYLLSTFPFDGFHFESGDQGRCECEQCKGKGDSAYHLELNRHMAEYVRSRWPGKIVEVYCPIGHRPKEDWLLWSEASRHFSFLIDDWSRAERFGCESRKDIISAFGCAYGTRSGRWVYPPQRWNRLRWFVPIIADRADHYRKLARDGGRAVMIQGAPLVNPGEEATLRCSGKLAVDPSRTVRSVLCEAMVEMFDPATPGVTEELADIFWCAEKAYFANAVFFPAGGELHMEPLCGTVPGPPVYLQARMYAHTLAEYEAAIEDIQGRFSTIRGEVRDRQRAGRLATCLASVLEDIAAIKADGSMLKYPASTVDGKTWTDSWLWEEQPG